MLAGFQIIQTLLGVAVAGKMGGLCRLSENTLASDLSLDGRTGEGYLDMHASTVDDHYMHAF
jgi:hypothetical protein